MRKKLYFLRWLLWEWGFKILTGLMFSCFHQSSTLRVSQQISSDLKIEATFSAVSGAVKACYSPDGKWIVTAGNDDVVRLWDAQSGRFVHTLIEHENQVKSLQFSPDGQSVLSASFDATARVFEITTGQQLFILKHPEPLWSATFSPDGKYIMTAAEDGFVRVFDAKIGRLIGLLDPNKDTYVRAAAYSPDGKWIIVAKMGAYSQVWDAKTMQRFCPLYGLERSAFSIEISPDSQFVLLVDTSVIQIFRIQTCEFLFSIQDQQSKQLISSATYSMDGKSIVSTHTDQTRRVWNATSGKLMKTYQHFKSVESLSFSPDQMKMLIVDSDSLTQVLDVRSEQVIFSLNGHSFEIESAEFSPDGKSIVTASQDGSARIWDSHTGIVRSVFIPPKTNRGTFDMTFATYSPNGKFLVTASEDHIAMIWDVETSQLIHTLKGHHAPVVFASYSPDGKFVITASNDNTVQMWDASSGQWLRSFVGHTQRVWSSEYSPDGNLIVTASADGVPQVWDAHTGLPKFPLIGHTDEVWTASFSPDGQYIVSAGFDKTVRIWEAQTGKFLSMQQQEGIVKIAAYSPDGNLLVTSNDHDQVQLWKVQKGMFTLFKQIPAKNVWSVRFSKDGKSMLTLDRFGVIQVWNLPEIP